ncbi:MAG: SDR family oxidoreductase [Clostridia bacterium]|nr:SDR family oxidoreductase [Clostridia bacterium]
MKQVNLKNRKCLITGASRGIGREIARYLHQEGVTLCLVATKQESFYELKKEIGENNIYYLCGDLLDMDFSSSLPERAFELMDGLDYIINNAGIAFAKPFLESTMTDWDNIMALNAKVPFVICKNAVPLLKKSEVPTIINLSSVVGKKGYENQSLYSASKHALEGFTKAFAKEVQQDGIRVHLIAPGGVKTEMVMKTRPDLDASLLIEADEIADLIVFLLTRRNNGVIENIEIRRESNQAFK